MAMAKASMTPARVLPCLATFRKISPSSPESGYSPAITYPSPSATRNGVFRHVDGLGRRATQERLHRGQHPHVAHVMDRAVPHGAVEHGVVLLVQMGSAPHRVVLPDVGDDVRDVAGRVAELLQRLGHPLV